MIITFFPVRAEAPLLLIREGAKLEINGSVIALEGYRAGDSDAIIGQPVHDGVQWHVNLVLPHGGQAPEQTLFPGQITLEGDGPVPLPPFEIIVEDYGI